MPNQTISLEQTLELANAANLYANTVIKKGCTQLEANLLPPEFRDHLGKGVHDLRGYYRERALKLAQNSNLYPQLIEYQQVIQLSAKYSIGNCYELAFQGLDYVLRCGPTGINAEIFHIAGGDHVILVLNRDPKSDPSNPNTWGKNAVICDPWSKKVYPASEYLNLLRNYRKTVSWQPVDGRLKKITKNVTEKFSREKHALEPIPYFNSTYLRLVMPQAKTKTKLIAELVALTSLLIEYQKKLTIEAMQVCKQYGANNQKYMILKSKITEINKHILNLNSSIFNFSKISNKILKKTNLQAEMLAFYLEVKDLILFSEEHKQVLSSQKNNGLFSRLRGSSSSDTTTKNIMRIQEETQKAVDGKITFFKNVKKVKNPRPQAIYFSH